MLMHELCEFATADTADNGCTRASRQSDMLYWHYCRDKVDVNMTWGSIPIVDG